MPLYSMYILKSVRKATQITFFLLNYLLSQTSIHGLSWQPTSEQCDWVRGIPVQGFHAQAMIDIHSPPANTGSYISV